MNYVYILMEMESHWIIFSKVMMIYMWNLKIITLATISSEGKKHWRSYVSGSDGKSHQNGYTRGDRKCSIWKYFLIKNFSTLSEWVGWFKRRLKKKTPFWVLTIKIKIMQLSSLEIVLRDMSMWVRVYSFRRR